MVVALDIYLTSPSLYILLHRLEQGFDTMEKQKVGADGLLKADVPDSLIIMAWDIFLLTREEAIMTLESKVLDALKIQKAGKQSQLAWAYMYISRLFSLLMCVGHFFLISFIHTGLSEAQLLVREGLQEAAAPFNNLILRAWKVIHIHVVGQCGTFLQAVRGITATYRMTNKRPPERASPFVTKILDPLRVLEADAKGR